MAYAYGYRTFIQYTEQYILVRTRQKVTNIARDAYGTQNR